MSDWFDLVVRGVNGSKKKESIIIEEVVKELRLGLGLVVSFHKLNYLFIFLYLYIITIVHNILLLLFYLSFEIIIMINKMR